MSAEPEHEDLALEAIVDTVTEQVRRGEELALEPILRRHPEHADELREILPLVAWLERSSPDGDVLRPGATIGDFRIESELGRGGMGVVFLARELSLDRRVALKLLTRAARVDGRFRERFKREARAAARLEHPNIVSVYASGVHEGLAFLAMEYVEGFSLDRLVRKLRHTADDARMTGAMAPALRALREVSLSESSQWSRTAESTSRAGTGRQSSSPVHGIADHGEPTNTSLARASARGAKDELYFRNVAWIGARLSDALGYAHSHGILHRDVKPANVLLNANGRVAISDFGLCDLDDGEDLTRSEDVVGTLRYMAPEQFDGQCDVRTDLYGLGATLYELVTLQPPFDGARTAALAHRVLHAEPPRPRRLNPAIPKPLEAIVLKAMAKTPDERYANAQALQSDLLAFLSDRPVKARPPRLADLLRLALRRNRAASAVLMAGVVGLVLLTGLYIQSIRGSRAEGQRRLYRSSIEAAASGLRASDGRQAARSLAEAPEPWRDWEWYHLGARLRDELDLVRTPGDGIVDLDSSSDGRYLLAALGDSRVHLFDRETPELDRSWKHHRGIPKTAFSADSETFVSVGTGKRAYRYSVAGDILSKGTLPLAAAAVAVHPSGNPIAVGSQDGEVRLFDREWNPIGPPLYRGSGAIRELAFNDSDRLFGVGLDRRLVAIEWRSGRTLFERELGAPILSLDLLQPEQWLVTAEESGTVRLFDAEGGTQRMRWDLRSGVPTDCRFGGDGKLVVATRYAGVWALDLTNEADISSIPIADSGTQRMDFDATRGTILFGGLAGTIHEKHLASRGGLVDWMAHNGDIHQVRFSPVDMRVATTSRDAQVLVWDGRTGAFLQRLLGHDSCPWAVTFSPSGRLLATGDDRGRLILWDLDEGRSIASFQAGNGRGYRRIREIEFSADESRLYACVRRDKALVLSVPELESVALAFEPPQDARALAVDPKRGLVAFGLHKSIEVRDLKTLELLWEAQPHERGLSRMRFHPTEPWLATAAYDGRVILWDVEERREVRRLEIDPERAFGFGHEITGLDFHPSGRRLAIATRAQEPFLWDPYTGEELHVLAGIPQWGSAIAFSFDGSALACGSNEGRLRVWDARPGAERRELLDDTLGTARAWLAAEIARGELPSADDATPHVDAGSSLRRIGSDRTTAPAR